MSELAFDKDSEPIEIHPDMEWWAVRAFQNPGARGTCAIARDDEGAPIHIERDGGFLDLKRAVRGVPALYRLDQCDGSRARIVGAPAAYVLIADPQRNTGLGAGLESSSQEPMLLVVVELIRAFGDAHRVLVKEQAIMMRSAAEVLRAADQAGISKRPAPPPVPAAVVDDDNDDDLEDEADDEDDVDELPPPKHISEVLVEKLIPKLDMMLSHYIAKRMKSDAPPPAAAPSPTPTPAPAPAPAAAPSAASPPAGAAAGPSPTSPPPSAADPDAPTQAATGATETTTVEPTSGPSNEGPARNATPTITPEQINHLLAIRARLTPREQAIADLVRERMTPAQQEQWLVELSAMTVEQALQIVRSMIPKPTSKRPPGVPTSTEPAPLAHAAPLAVVTPTTEEDS